jgi:hypothetical protein
LHALEFSLLLAEVGSRHSSKAIIAITEPRILCAWQQNQYCLNWLNKSKYIMKSELNLCDHVYKLGAILYKEQYCNSFLMATRQKLFDLKDGKECYILRKNVHFMRRNSQRKSQCTKNKFFWQKHQLEAQNY